MKMSKYRFYGSQSSLLCNPLHTLRNIIRLKKHRAVGAPLPLRRFLSLYHLPPISPFYLVTQEPTERSTSN